MPNTIQIKRRTSAGGNQAGAPSSLVLSELAFNEVDNTLYIGRSTAGSTPITIAAIGGAGAFLALSGTQTAAGSYTFNTGTVTLDGTVTGTGINNYFLTKRLNEFTVPNASVAFNGQRITGLADPVNAQDAATKAYVDAARSGLDVKDSVKVASTDGRLLLGFAAGQVVDGYTLVAGDRILLKDQIPASQNGIYVVRTGLSPFRATDADTNAEVTPGMFTFVEQGTLYANSGWVLTNAAPVTLDTTSLTFAQFSGAGQITAGFGLTKLGNTLDVVTASAQRIVVNADSIDLATTGVSAGTYTSVTVDTYGRVTAGGNPVVIASGKTLTANNTLTLTGTDGSSVAFGAGGTVAYTGNNLSAFAATTSSQLADVISDETGSGALVFANSPSFTTPALGAATATSINRVALTQPAAGSTLTIADGKTLTASNTLTFTGTDSSSVAFGAGGTVAYAGVANAFTGANTFVNATGQTFRQAANNDGIVIKGRAGGSSGFNATLDTATLTVSRAYSLPDHGASITACTLLSNESTLDGGTF